MEKIEKIATAYSRWLQMQAINTYEPKELADLYRLLFELKKYDFVNYKQAKRVIFNYFAYKQWKNELPIYNSIEEIQKDYYYSEKNKHQREMDERVKKTIERLDTIFTLDEIENVNLEDVADDLSDKNLNKIEKITSEINEVKEKIKEIEKEVELAETSPDWTLKRNAKSKLTIQTKKLNNLEKERKELLFEKE